MVSPALLDRSKPSNAETQICTDLVRVTCVMKPSSENHAESRGTPGVAMFVSVTATGHPAGLWAIPYR